MPLEPIGTSAAVEYGDPDHLLIFVMGFAPPGPPQFGFKKFAARFNKTKLYLTDPEYPYSFYRKGLGEIANNHDEVLEFLRFFIDRMGPKRVSIISGSIGSSPSVAWGTKLGVDDIHLMGPVSDVRVAVASDRAEVGMFAELSAHIRQNVIADYPYWNVRDILMEAPDAVGCVDIYYGQDDEIDRMQAENMLDLPMVRATAYHNADHMRLPVYVQRRDPDLTSRLMEPTVARPAELRKSGNGPLDLGYAVVWPA